MKSISMIEELRAARIAWHEANGVPVSVAYARFLEAVGALEDAAASSQAEPLRTEEQPMGAREQLEAERDAAEISYGEIAFWWRNVAIQERGKLLKVIAERDALRDENEDLKKQVRAAYGPFRED